MTAEGQELARLVGELQGQVGALKAETAEQRRESRESADKLHARVSQGHDKLMAEIRENTRAIRDLEADRIGDRAIGRFKRSVGYFAIALSGGGVVELIRAIWAVWGGGK